MTLVRVPTDVGGDWWVVMHPLAVADRRLRHIRPIHVLTLLSQLLGAERTRMFGDSLALENKLFAIGMFLEQLRGAISQIGDPIYPGAYIRDYRDHQRFISVLESYLGAIYSSLELAARINRQLHQGLPIGFRRQAKKFAAFHLEGRDWLKQFYDLRSELQHFGTLLPQVKAEPSIVVEFSQATRLEYFKPGRYEIPLADIASYGPMVFGLLDDWARTELAGVDPNAEIDVVTETGVTSQPKHEKVRAASILDLIKK